MSAAQNELTIKAADVAAQDTQRWRAFLQAFEKYALEQANQCVRAPADSLQVAQGRARNCLELQTLFEKAVQDADRLKRRP